MHQQLDSPNESVCPDSEGTPQINMILHFLESPYLFLFSSQGSILQKGCTRIMNDQCLPAADTQTYWYHSRECKQRQPETEDPLHTVPQCIVSNCAGALQLNCHGFQLWFESCIPTTRCASHGQISTSSSSQQTFPNKKNIQSSKHTRWQMLPFQFQCWVAVQPAESEFETSTTPSCCSWFCQPIKNAHDRKKKILKLGLALGVHSGNHWGPYSILHCIPTCQWCDSKWPWIQNPRKPSDNCSRTMFTHVKKRKT
jgi:hypothetical protein